MQSNPNPDSNTFHLLVNLVQFTDNGHNGHYPEMSDKMRNESQNLIIRNESQNLIIGNEWQNELIASADSNTFLNSRLIVD